MVKMNADLVHWAPDQIAECVNGITEATYKELWSFVHEYEDEPRGECPGEVMIDLARFWDRLTEEAQININEATAKDWA